MANMPSGILSLAPKMEFFYKHWSDNVSQLLKTGELDLAFGHLTEQPNHVKQEVIGQDHYVLVHRKSHPHQDEWNLEKCLQYSHVSLKHSGIDDTPINRYLGQQNLTRHRVVSTSDIVAALSLIKASDYIMIAPSHLTQYLAPDLVQVPAPFPETNIEYCLYWGRH